MSIDFDTVTETAAALFGRALEEGPQTQEFFAAWDAAWAAVLREHPGTPVAVIGFAVGLAFGRWEAKNGCLPENCPAPARLQ